MRIRLIMLLIAGPLALSPAPAFADRRDSAECRQTGSATVECGSRSVHVDPVIPGGGGTGGGSSPGRPGTGGSAPSGGGNTRSPGTPTGGPPSNPGSNPGSYHCTSYRFTPSQAAQAGLRARTGGSWVADRCFHLTGNGAYTTYRFEPSRPSTTPRRPAGPPVDPGQVARSARDRLVLPSPVIHLNPDGDQIVQLETWLWIDPSLWHPITATANAGGVSATATAVPRSVAWAMGDGNTVTCRGPGRAYDRHRRPEQQRTDCGHTYRRSSAGQPGDRYLVTATITWDVTWTATGVPGGGNLGAMTTTGRVPVRVSEIQALNQ